LSSPHPLAHRRKLVSTPLGSPLELSGVFVYTRGVSKIISQWEAVGFVTEVLVSVAVPTTLLALLGRWADAKYGTSPWLTILGLLLALGIAALLVTKRAKEMAKRMSGKE
jgi:LPXTG-motif cell wall-anchored protein